MDADYDSKQHDLDVLQSEVVKLEAIVAAISDNVRDRKHSVSAAQTHTRFSSSSPSSSAAAAASGATEQENEEDQPIPAVAQTPLHGSPANRLAASAASAAQVARQLAAEEDRQYLQSMSALSQSASASQTAAHLAAQSSPRRAQRASDVQRQLQSQLNQLELEVHNIAADRRRH